MQEAKQKKCPCCGNALKERVSIDGLAIVHECQTWGCFFRCNCTMVDKIVAAMELVDVEGPFVEFEDYAKLRALVEKLEAALRKIADGRGLIPDASTIYMDGTQPNVPKVFSRNDMQEIAMRAMGEE